MLSGLLVGVLAGVSSATTTYNMNMTSGTFGVHGNSPGALPAQVTTTLTGQVNSSTGAITASTLSIPPNTETNQGSTETIHITEVTAGSATGSINYLGNVAINDVMAIEVDITSPISEQCVSTPVDLSLTSTSPYSSSTGNVTLSDTTFSIPSFSSTNCGLAYGQLNSQFAGSSGNVLTLSLNGTLPLPPAPAASSATTLSASPSSPQIQGTAVTLTAAITSGGAPATTATGTVQFYSGTNALGLPQPVSSASATLVITALPGGTDSLTAVYTGDSNFTGSTSSAVGYTIEPTPSVTVSVPTSVTTGSGTPTPFSVTLSDPSGGSSYSGNLWLALNFSGIILQSSSSITLDYEDGGGNWCPMTFSGLNATYEGSGTPPCGTPSAFSLSAGSNLTVTHDYGSQTISATLETESGGTVVAPLSGSIAPVGSGVTVVAPATPFAVTVGVTVPASEPQGFAFKPAVTVTKPTKPTLLPLPSGSVTIKIDGTTVATYPSAALASVTPISTTGLSVGSHTLGANYAGSLIYAPGSASTTLLVASPVGGTMFSCTESFLGSNLTGNAVLTATANAVPTYATSGSAVPVSGLNVTVNLDVNSFDDPSTNLIASNGAGFTPGGSAINGALVGTAANFAITGEVDTGSFSGLSTTTGVPINGSAGTVVPVGLNSFSFTVATGLGLDAWSCTSTSSVSLGSVTVTNPVTWTVGSCTTGSTTAPSWATTMKVVANGAGGGGGGAAASANGYGGAGGAGSSVTSYFAITGGGSYSGKSGCGGSGAPQGSGVVGNGGAAVSGWSGGGAGGQGTYCANLFGSCGSNDGTGGSGGGSTGVCSGSTCTSAGTPLVVAGGGGGGGESMCSGTSAGSAGQAGNGSSTSAHSGAGNSGSAGGGGGTGGVAGGSGGVNSAGGSAAGSTGGHGGSSNYLGDSAASGGGGGGYVGGTGGANNGNDADCGAGGGGGGGSSWVASAGTSTTFGTGSAGGSSSGSNGTGGSLTVTFS